MSKSKKLILSKRDKVQIFLALIGTNLAVVACVGMSISEVRQDTRADNRQINTTAKAAPDKNSDQITVRAAPEAPEAE